MRLARLKLTNWRNFVSVDVSLPLRAFLVGPNASGKSNFLDALRFLRDVACAGGLREAVRRRGGLQRVRCLAAARQPAVALEAEIVDHRTAPPTTWSYTLEFNRGGQTKTVQITTEVVRRDGVLTMTHLEQVAANKEFRQVADFLGLIKYYHIVPQLVRDPERYVGGRDDPFGGDFLERVAGTTKKKLDSRLRRIEKALRVAVPQLSELKLERDAAGRPHLRGKYQHWRAQGAWQTEHDFSDGTLRLLGLLWSLLDDGGPLLLEEPELSLHTAVVRRIPSMIAAVQRRAEKRQVIVSTHSLDLLRDEDISPDEVFVFRPTEAGTKVEVLCDRSEVQLLLEDGIPIPEVVSAITPPNTEQLALFGE